MDRDGPLPTAGKLRAIVGYRIHQVNQPLFRQHVHQQRGNRLGCGEVADRRLRGHRNPDRIRGIVRPVAGGVANGAMQDLFAPVANRNLDTRVYAGPVKPLNTAPDRLDSAFTDTCGSRIFTRSVPEGDGCEISGNLAGVKRTTGKSVHLVRPLSRWLFLFYLQFSRHPSHWPTGVRASVNPSSRQRPKDSG